MVIPKFKPGDIVKLTPDGYQIRIFDIILPKAKNPRIKDNRIKVDSNIYYFCKWIDIDGKEQTGNYPEWSLLLA